MFTVRLYFVVSLANKLLILTVYNRDKSNYCRTPAIVFIMQKKIDVTTASSVENKTFLIPAIPEFFVDIGMKSYNWFEKAMLLMLNESHIDFNLNKLCCIFYAIRGTQGVIPDLGENIYILDQFLRRLDAINESTNTVTEIALVSAAVGLKVASDLAVWNQDLLGIYNRCITNFKYQKIEISVLKKLEIEHLGHLDFFVEFGAKSNTDERIQNIMNFIDLEGIHLIEKALLSLVYNRGEVMIGSVIQLGIFKKTSETPMSFFRKGSTQSKDDDDIPCKTIPHNESRANL